MIDACGRLALRGMEFTLSLVGQGPERERLQQRASRAGLRHFEILPNQDQRTLGCIYRAASAFVLPTLEDVWGLVVSEALWAGTTVLCSKYAGCAEIVPPENVFDPISEDSFDAALAKVFDGSLRRSSSDALVTCEEVGEAIARSIALGSPSRKGKDALNPVLAITGVNRPE